jgi:hypothetical protein
MSTEDGKGQSPLNLCIKIPLSNVSAVTTHMKLRLDGILKQVPSDLNNLHET